MSFRGKIQRFRPGGSERERKARSGGGESGPGTRPDVGSLQFERGVHLEGVVITTSGHCYDKDLLAKYAEQNRNVCPLTGEATTRKKTSWS